MDIALLQKKLGIKSNNPALISQAFIHRSHLNESKVDLQSNERLEFLGDSILSFLTSQFLYKTYPDCEEGTLTNIRSSLVKTTTLAQVALDLHLGDLLKLSKGEEESGGRKNVSLLADTFEAFLGAVYLTSDLETAQDILSKYLFPKLSSIMENKTYKDAKSMFQEIVQEQTKVSPQYKVLKEVGPDHAKQFSVGVFVSQIKWGEGEGKSKQEAQQQAARVALEKWQKKE